MPPTPALTMSQARFRKTVLDYYRQSGRDFPWRRTADPYRICVSELMLQQTQANRAIEKYKEFIGTFPDFRSLARAPLRRVLRVWSGLGYNRRAIYLKRISEQVVKNHHGRLPADFEALRQLPGIGPGTAGAIMAYAFNLPVAFIETNIRSIYIHHFFKKKKRVSDQDIMALVERTLDRKNPRRWYWALMDYGTYLKQQFPNPSRRSRHYAKQSAFEGSLRQVRGRILKLLVGKPMAVNQLQTALQVPPSRIRAVLKGFVAEGLVRKKGIVFIV